MSAILAGIKTLPYIGDYYAKPIAYAAGEIILTGNKSKATVPLNLQWNVYWQLLNKPASVGIVINLNSQNTTGGLIDRIRAIKIDNSFSTVPIYVQFPDTLDVVTCPPQTICTLPVISNSLNPIIYATGLTAGFIPTTLIQLLNYKVEPTVDPAIQITFPQWLGSPTQQATNLLTPGYGSPALGDQTENRNGVGNSGSAPINNLFGTPRASGVIILTGLSYGLQGINGNVTGNAMQLSLVGAIRGILYQWLLLSIALSGREDVFSPMFSRSAMNLRLDATDTYSLSFAGTGAQVNFFYLFNSEYCYQP